MPEVLNKPRTSAEPSLNPAHGDVVAFGPFVFDRVNGLLRRSGVDVALPPRAVGVLARLIDRAGDVVSKAELLDHVWKDTFVTEVSLTEAISLLRQTLGDDRSGQPTSRRSRVAATGSWRRSSAQSLRWPWRGSTAPTAHGNDRRRGRPGRGGLAGMVALGGFSVMLLALVGVSAGLRDQPGMRERPVTRFTVDPGVGVVPVER